MSTKPRSAPLMSHERLCSVLDHNNILLSTLLISDKNALVSADGVSRVVCANSIQMYILIYEQSVTLSSRGIWPNILLLLQPNQL